MAFQVVMRQGSQSIIVADFGIAPSSVVCYLAAIRYFRPEERILEFVREEEGGARIFRSHWYPHSYLVKKV